MARILIVDDDRALLKAWEVRLRAAGYEVIVAADGAKGLLLAEMEQPDLILLDVRMRGMDGYEVCRMLTSNAATASIPVIIMSANLGIDSGKQAMESGAVAFLHKPLTAKQVLAVFDSVLAGRTVPTLRKEIS